MGLYLNLCVNFQKISPPDWEQTYLESLDLLQKCPLPLMHCLAETRLGTKRYSNSGNLVHDAGKADEKWAVSGDKISEETAESFWLYRHHKHYYKNKDAKKFNADKSVFFVAGDRMQYSDACNGENVWGDKTQGYPFHLAMLAVGIFFENKFEGECYLVGDIEAKDARKALEWLNFATDSDFKPLICLDADRLLYYCKEAYEDAEKALERFETLYRQGKKQMQRAIIKHFGIELARKRLAVQLNEYDSYTWGTDDLIKAWLEVTDDVEEVVKLVKLANDLKLEKSKSEKTTANDAANDAANIKLFDYEGLVKRLCEMYITINPVKRENLQRVLGQKSQGMKTSDDQLSNVFMRMAGAPSMAKQWIHADDLFEIFMVLDPKNAANFKKIIDDFEQKANNTIEKAGDIVEIVEQKIDETPALTEHGKEVEQTLAQYAPAERYFIEQALRQKRGFADINGAARKIGRQIQSVMTYYEQKEKDSKVHYATKKEALVDMYRYSIGNGVVLLEEAWTTIDALEDLQLLELLTLYMAVAQREMNFWRWRMMLLQTPAIWDDFLAGAKEEIEKPSE